VPGVAQGSAAEADPIVEKVNEARASHGLRPLRPSPSLARSATRYSRWLMGIDRFFHDDRIHASSSFGRLGEALALHPGWRPQRGNTVRRWLRSSGHRALLLSRSFRLIGAGIARGRYGSGHATIWTLQLGTR
jgi:uncharacterized protein YkwD